MAYIPSHQSLRDHPKLKRFARQLGIKEVHAIGHLHCFWWWALDYAPNGSLENHDALDIAIGSEWEGDPEVYVQSLVDCRFIERVDSFNETGCTYIVHDWDEYGGKYQEKLLKDRDRKRKERDARRNSATVPDVSDGSPQEIRRTARQGEERREEKSNVNPPPPRRVEYAPEFEELWRAYPSGFGVKNKSYEQWRKVKDEHDAIMVGLAKWHQSDRWHRGVVKACELWIRDRMWENPPPRYVAADVPHNKGGIMRVVL